MRCPQLDAWSGTCLTFGYQRTKIEWKKAAFAREEHRLDIKKKKYSSMSLAKNVSTHRP